MYINMKFLPIGLSLLHFCCPVAFAELGLYNSSDPLILLDSRNFYDKVLGVKNGWIIQFYNSWCGHCINFAPEWKEFSKEIEGWDHTIKSAVVDCSVDENLPICRDYEVMEYPSLRIFGAFIKKGNIGKNVVSGSPLKMIDSVVENLIEFEKEDKGASSWKMLLPYDGLISNLIENAPKTAKYGIIIAEEIGSTIGSQTILDLGNYAMIYARRMDSKKQEIIDMNLASFPSIVILHRSGAKQLIEEKVSSRKELTALIKKKLVLLKKKTSVKNTNKPVGKGDFGSSASAREEAEGAGDGKPDEASSDRLDYDDDFPDSAFSSDDSKVFMVDMENAVTYALKHEVKLHKNISGDLIKALKDFLKALILYFPSRPQIRNFLVSLNNFVQRSGEELTAEGYEKALTYLTSRVASLPDQQPWKGCQGSSPKYRGYPCGLWTLFHTISVNALITKEKNMSNDSFQPLRAIHGYVKYFFTCKYCAKHFQEMYASDAESSMKTPSDEVLWLWQGHNKVNKRLKGDLSEDPKHPKEQFPSRTACSQCWKNSQFDNVQIINYLKKTYGRRSISLEGTQKMTKLFDSQRVKNRQARVFDDDEKRMIADENVADISEKNTNYNWSFNNTDINLCVVLYFFSAVIIVAGYMLFIIKRRLRRKKFYDLYKKP